MPFALEEVGEATLRLSHEARREILGNKQTTWIAYAHIAHARVGSQVAQGCSTDATQHAHAVTMTTHHQHRDVSPGAHAHHHRTLDPVGVLRIAPRGFHSKYNLLFPLPGQGGDESKLYLRGSGAPLLAPEHQFGEAECADRARASQPGHPETHTATQKCFRQSGLSPYPP